MNRDQIIIVILILAMCIGVCFIGYYSGFYEGRESIVCNIPKNCYCWK